MGYTQGRKLDIDTLFFIAQQYKTRSEFQTKDPSAYSTARKNNLLDKITKHMKNVSFSIPQLVLRYILDYVLFNDKIKREKGNITLIR